MAYTREDATKDGEKLLKKEMSSIFSKRETDKRLADKEKKNPFAESWKKKNEKVHAKARSKALSKAK